MKKGFVTLDPEMLSLGSLAMLGLDHELATKEEITRASIEAGRKFECSPRDMVSIRGWVLVTLGRIP